jgi:hypothetical protein
MPPKSQNQAVAMNLANAIQKGDVAPKPGTPSAEIAKSMKPGALSDFTGPIPAGLPKKVTPPPAPPMAMPQPQMAPKMKTVGGPGPGRPSMRVKNVGKPVKKMRFM